MGAGADDHSSPDPTGSHLMSLLGMFARYPQPGQTKTRLATGVGDEVAAEIYAAFVTDLVARCGGLADELWLALTPDTKSCRAWSSSLPLSASSKWKIVGQPEGNLGDRINWFFQQAADKGGGPAVLIGTDSPDLPSTRISVAIRMLSNDEADMVIVPSADGGYALIGLNNAPDGLFDRIRWSSPFTLTDTLQAADRCGLAVELLPMWYDIDTIENLGTLLALQTVGGERAECPATMEAAARVLRMDGD